MLIRFVVNNVLSFGKEQEFNLLPAARLKRLNHHKYTLDQFQFLKLSTIYGANGAGKSNLIKAITFLSDLITEHISASEINKNQYKFNNENKAQLLGIEFFKNDIPFLYAVKISKGIILTEELYYSGLGRKEDELIFERHTNGESHQTKINFFPSFERKKENKLLKQVIEKNLIKPNQLLLPLLKKLENEDLQTITEVSNWFEYDLQIVFPASNAVGLIHKMDTDLQFYAYANHILQSFNTGITNIKMESISLLEFFGADDQSIIDEIETKFTNTNKAIAHIQHRGQRIYVSKDKDGIIKVRQLKFQHHIDKQQEVLFSADEESDGTRRLLDYVYALYEIVNEKKTYIIDEIERSIHPALIKTLINKFADDEQTRGQLIFTTHESNLLDQQIFRSDEIWFTEKQSSGSTTLYPLSEFKEHHTKDIRKGYLNGRYGAIPFMGNLKDLNWNTHAITQ